MAFKRPGNSRDDRSANSSNRTSRTDDRSKKPSGSAGGRSSNSSSFNRQDDRPKRAAGSKPYGTGPANDRPKRNSDSYRDANPRVGSDAAAEKRPYAASKKPYTGRPSTADQPRSPYRGASSRGGSESAGEKRPYTVSRTPYTGKPATEGRPKRNPDSYKSAGTRGGGNNQPTERKFGDRPNTGFNSRRPAGDSPAGDRPGTGFKKRSDGINDRPYRKPAGDGPAYRPERAAVPERTMRSRKKAAEKEDTGLIRLNRYISNAGICSRRKADELISAGVVSVNGEVVSELGYKVDPSKDVVRYNGETLKRERMVYVLLNKPKDYITTTDDPQERRTVMQLVDKASKERIYPIGRLDRNTTGLLLMTNDGDLADKLSHPKNNIVKLYHVELSKSLTQGDLNKIGFGLELEDGFIKPDSVSYVQGASKKEVGIQIHSGKNRIVRRIFEYLGYEVVKLDRAVYANLTKKDLPRGRWRYLTDEEVIQLKHLI